MYHFYGVSHGFFNLVSPFTSVPINHVVYVLFLQNTSCIRKPQVISLRGGVGAQPLHPPPGSIPVCGLYATLTFPIMHHICPPKFCITFVFHFSWVLHPFQEKFKTNRVQNFGEQRRCIMGNVEVAYRIHGFGQEPITFISIQYLR